MILSGRFISQHLCLFFLCEFTFFKMSEEKNLHQDMSQKNDYELTFTL